ncbi:unnamed protein product [Polarella glacialis]|uniref:Uncharacterized protein n=1 Tax=Polarella glacialis TaxID=89957 RepID=A0A813LMI3_POLGL|nr:unnamed protein product [Polarella glacialis]
MLEGLTAKIAAEAEAEMTTYREFERWCTGTAEEKTSAITANNNTKQELETNIESLSLAIDEIAGSMEGIDQAFVADSKSIREGVELRVEEKVAYASRWASSCACALRAIKQRPPAGSAPPWSLTLMVKNTLISSAKLRRESNGEVLGKSPFSLAFRMVELIFTVLAYGPNL